MRFLIVLLTVLWANLASAAIVCVGAPTPTPTPTPTPAAPGENEITLGGQVYTINDHPRIFLSATKLTDLIARSATGKTVWDALKAENNNKAAGCASNAVTAEALNFAVGWKASDNSEVGWRDCAIAELENLQDVGLYNFDYGSINMMTLAVVYDWMYNDMTELQRQAMRDFVYDELIPFVRTHPCDHHSPASWCDERHNLNHTKGIGEFIWNLATIKDDSRADEMIVWNHDTWWSQNVVPIFADSYPGGQSYGGSHYGYNRTYKYVLWLGHALETALSGYDPWASWMTDITEYSIHANMPNDDFYHCAWEPGTIKWGASSPGRRSINIPIAIAVDETDSMAKMGQYFLDNVLQPNTSSSPARGHINSIYLGKWHIWYDEDNAETNYNTLDLGYVASGTDTLFTRDAWADSEATWASLMCAHVVGDHQTSNMGSFRIFREGEFAVIENDPRYCVGNPGGSESDPIHANILYLGDGMVSGFETGGFPRRFGDSTSAIEDFTQGTTYLYGLCNLDSAYYEATFPVDYGRRHFVHFRPTATEPNYFIIHDGIKTANSETKKTYTYVPENPTTSTNVSTFSLTNSDVKIQTVYPTGINFTETAVTDQTTAGEVPQNGTDTPTLLEVRQTTPGNAENFLKVVMVDDTGGSFPTLTALTGAGATSGSMKGVLIADATQNRVYLGTIDNTTVQGNVTFTAAVSGTTEYLLVGLPASQQYTFAKDGNNHTLTAVGSGRTHNATSDGVLRFTN
jgi:hypothetical protein